METNNLYRRLLYKSKKLTKEQELYYIKEYKNSNNSIYKNRMAEILINSYRPFVYFQALKYSKNEEIVHDLMSEGNIGIFIALKQYNVNLNNSFLTFANYYITKYMLLYLNNIEYKQEKNYIDDVDVNIAKYEMSNALFNEALEKLKNNDLKQIVKELFSLAHLTQLEINILKLYYGILNDQIISIQYTYKEISNTLNISEAKVKKSIKQSILKLKKYAREKKIYYGSI